MTSQHTPGPWIGAGPSFGDKLPRYINEIVTEREDEDGEVESICEFPFAHFDEQNEANARLIAAAPDLLDALQMAKHIVANEGTDAQMAQVFAAIEKATGAAA